jgi:hypothetical protein
MLKRAALVAVVDSPAAAVAAVAAVEDSPAGGLHPAAVSPAVVEEAVVVTGPKAVAVVSGPKAPPTRQLAKAQLRAPPPPTSNRGNPRLAPPPPPTSKRDKVNPRPISKIDKARPLRTSRNGRTIISRIITRTTIMAMMIGTAVTRQQALLSAQWSVPQQHPLYPHPPRPP